MIKEFQGKYRWLSNFWLVDIDYKGRIFSSVEHAYMSEKNDSDIWKNFCAKESDPKIVNKMSRIIILRTDWDDIKLSFMEDLTRIKYQDLELRKKLLATDDEYLQEGNDWGDTFWGIDLKTGEGKNNFGKIRDELKIMNKLTQKIDFGDGKVPDSHFQNFEKIIRDRRSVYSVSIGYVESRDDIKEFLQKTKKLKNHNKATHHTWAVRISNNGVVYESKSDDGETGAGNIVLRMIQKKNMVNTVICVTRWFGGIKLEADRFKHVQDATLYALEQVRDRN